MKYFVVGDVKATVAEVKAKTRVVGSVLEPEPEAAKEAE